MKLLKIVGKLLIVIIALAYPTVVQWIVGTSDASDWWMTRLSSERLVLATGPALTTILTGFVLAIASVYSIATLGYED